MATPLGTGVQVNDADAVDLLAGATLDSATSSNGTVRDLLWPRWVKFRLVTGTVTGTSPTLDVTLQASSTSDFSSDVVDLGAFPQVGDEDAVPKVFRTYVTKRYVRASVTTGGTSPDYSGTTLKAEDPQTRNESDDTA